MKWKKVERGGIALSLIALAILGCLAISSPSEATDEEFLTVTLIIEHYDYETGLTRTTVKTGDLLLENFAKFITMWTRGNDAEVTATKTGGAQAHPYYDTASQTCTSYAEVHIGTGTTSPSPSNYCLNNTVLEEKVTDGAVVTSGTTMNVTVSAVFNIEASYSITEAGLVLVGTYAGAGDYMVARDTFTAIDVSSGDVLTVTYTITLNG